MTMYLKRRRLYLDKERVQTATSVIFQFSLVQPPFRSFDKLKAFRFSRKCSLLPETRFILNYLYIDSIKLCGARLAALPLPWSQIAPLHKEKFLFLQEKRNIFL